MTEKTRQKISKSKSFVLLLGEFPEEHELLLREALKETMSFQNLACLLLPDPPENFLRKWNAIIRQAPEISFPKKTSIRLPKSRYEVREVSYKESEDELFLIITAGNQILSINDLLLEKLPVEPEAVICFFEKEEDLSRLNGNFNLPNKENIFFVSKEAETLTEKIFDVAKIFNPSLLDKENVAAIFLASLLKETNGLTENTTENVFHLAATLSGKSGRFKNAVEAVTEGEKNTSFSQLLGRILARTFVDSESNVSWSFLNARDIQKTGNFGLSYEDMRQLLKTARKHIVAQDLHILMWQPNGNVEALVIPGLAEGTQAAYHKLQESGLKKTGGFLTAGPFENFTSAEINLRQILKEGVEKKEEVL
ncbi:MAG: hypothetical protein PHC85_02185 [Candidatus Pacebacteria bacterium]|nr:hypothetical protein [Candidatus Paceibacterota bacterium]